MDWLHWYDFITPTSPVAAIFFGVIFSIIAFILVRMETKDLKSALYALIGGISVTFIGVAILYFFGFYSN